MPSRRRFLASAASLAALGAVRCSTRPAAAPSPPGTSETKPEPAVEGPSVAETKPGKNILILGGTGFLGPHVVQAALDRGYEVTLFNRGKTNPHLFGDLEKLQGDRDGKLESLKAEIDRGRRWDAVVDTSGYVPRIVELSATLLAPASDQYLFVSSVSVYADQAKAGLTEDDPVGRLEDVSVEKVDGDTYGPLKALCEEAAEARYPGRATIVRPGLIVGPGDPTDRFTYWPVRIARGGPMIAPGSPTDPVQVIDVRDLATWMVGCIDHRHAGRYNAVGPAERLSIETMLKTCSEALESDVDLVWIDAEFLAKHEVQPWLHMTVWVPPDGESGGLGAVSNARARATGLQFRPLSETARETLAWWNELPPERRAAPRAGLAAEREREVLAAWQKRGKTRQ